jgi:hypothetical protein
VVSEGSFVVGGFMLVFDLTIADALFRGLLILPADKVVPSSTIMLGS